MDHAIKNDTPLHFMLKKGLPIYEDEVITEIEYQTFIYKVDHECHDTT